MKILTFNTWGKNGPYQKRFELISFELSKINADTVCLQEVFDAELKDTLIQSCGFKHSYECYPAGLVILSRFSFDKTLTHIYKRVSENEKNGSRAAILIHIKTKKTAYWIANTHLSWRPEENDIRMSQTQELLKRVNSLNALSILAGDFNCEPDSEAVDLLLKKDFAELYGKLNPGKMDFTWDNNRNPYLKTHSVIFPNRRIDLLLIHEKLLARFAAKCCELVFTKSEPNGIFPSDHFGLCAELL